MPRAFSTIAYTPSVRTAQQRYGSRDANATFDLDPDPRDRVTEREREFIVQRDHFFLASVGENGWPYVQHRGGPPGFLRILDERTLGFADFAGNRQYISAGNISHDDRVMLFLIDYANRRRLKVWGRARTVHEKDDPALIARLEMPNYRAHIERGYLITVEAFDFNCPQHITPRYTEAEAAELLAARGAQGREEKSPAPRVLGEGELELTIAGVRQLAPRVRAYELRRADGGELPPVSSGAHLRVPVRLPDGREETRSYSIATAIGRDSYEIAVLRDDNGGGGSAAVHRDYTLGTVLRCQPPKNTFSLHQDSRPSVLIAGGIGITPLKAMAATLHNRQRPFHLYYSAASPADMAYRSELAAELGAGVSFYFSRGGSARRLDLDLVFDQAPSDAVFYVCGPARLINAAVAAATARGIAPERVHYEHFDAPGLREDDRPIEIRLARAGKTLQVAADQTVLDAVLAAGVGAWSDCRVGTCGTCAIKVIDGTPDHRDSVLTEAEREHAGLMCPCVSRAKTASLVLDL